MVMAMTDPDPADHVPSGMWISVGAPPGGGTHIHLREEDGRIVADAVFVHGPEVTATTLQAVPVSHLTLAASIALAAADGGSGLWTLMNVIRYGYEYPLTVDDDAEPSLADLRGQAQGAPPELNLTEEARSSREPLRRPDGTDPEGFSARVAEAYREYSMQTRGPAVMIAAEAGVPVATVRSWIREARRRGKLPPGRRGKAG
jgi:hypothetical protein